MNRSSDPDSKLYYFIDIDIHSRQIIAWNIESRDQVEIKISNGCHRVFMSRGQYNKLTAKLEEARS